MSRRQPLSDAADRRSAVLTDRHAFVQASAGTGKTHTLTLRALYLLLTPGDDKLFASPDRVIRLEAARRSIRSVVLTTFTRKAAAEMQTRLFGYLDLIATSSDLKQLEKRPDGNRDPLLMEIVRRVLENKAADRFEWLRRGAQALGELAVEFQISTLHSFAARLLKRHPLEAGISPLLRFAGEDDESGEGFQERLVDYWWRSRAVSSRQLESDLAAVLRLATAAELRCWMDALLKDPGLLLTARALPEPSLEQSLRLLQAARAVGSRLSSLPNKKQKGTGEKMLQVLERVETGEEGSWRELLAFFLEHQGYLFLDGSGGNKGIRNAILESGPDAEFFFSSCLNAAPLACANWLRSDQLENWNAWCRILEDFEGWNREASIRELGLLTFEDIIRLAIGMLERHPEVVGTERARLRSILVDEFQDTDPRQLQLLELLLAGAGDAHEVLGFFVGDLKQSIYRFRKVDVESVTLFREQYEERVRPSQPPLLFHLKTSFRSLEPITAFVNGFFSQALDLYEGGEKGDESLHAYRGEEGRTPRWIYIDSDEAGQKLKSEDARRLASLEAARIIEELVSQGRAAYQDFLILVENHHELGQLLPVLRRAGVPVVSSGSKTFYQHYEVLDLLNLLIACHHPDDSLAVAAVLRSPLVFLSDPEIHRLLEKLKAGGVFQGTAPLPDFLPEAARDRIGQIRRLAAGRSLVSLSQWVDQLRTMVPVTAYLQRQDLEGRPLVRIEKVLTGFQEQMRSGSRAILDWLLEQREKAGGVDRWDVDLGEDVSLGDETRKAVRAMTIHKAKGLEGKIVIVLGWSEILQRMNGKSRGGDSAVLSNARSGGCEFRLPWAGVQIISFRYGEAYEKEQKQSGEEGRRLAYVAATRARDEMILVQARPAHHSYSQEVDDFLQLCTSGEVPSWLDFGFPEAAASKPPAPPSARLEMDPTRYRELWSGRLSRLREPEVRLLQIPSDPAWNDEAAPAGEPGTDVEEPGQSEVHRQAGRLVHLYLERFLSDEAFSRPKLEALGWARKGRFDPRAVQRASQILQDFLSGRTADSSGRSLKQRLREARIIGREIPVYLKIDNEAWHGIIDLVLQEGERLCGVDYKTMARPEELKPSYRQQERIYSEALGRAFPGRAIDFEFWWLPVSGGE